MSKPFDSVPPKKKPNEVINGILMPAKVFGIWPLNKNFEISLKQCIISMIANGFLVCLTLIVLHSFIGRNKPTLTTIWLFFSGHILSIFNIIFTVCWITYINLNFNLIEKELDRIQILVKNLTLPHNCSAFLHLAAFTSIFIIPALVIFRDYSDHIYHSKIEWYSHMLCYFVPYFLTLTILEQFLNFLVILRVVIKEVSKMADSTSMSICYESILSIWGNISECYGPFIFIFFTCNFLEMLTHLYSVIKHGGYSFLLWVLVLALPLFRIFPGLSTIKSSIAHLNKMIYKKVTSKLSDETLEFVTSTQREMVFSASGFFILDNSLICSMIGAGTTYLVILIQYAF